MEKHDESYDFDLAPTGLDIFFLELELLANETETYVMSDEVETLVATLPAWERRTLFEQGARLRKEHSQEALIAMYNRCSKVLDETEADTPEFDRILDEMEPLWQAILPENRT